MKFDKYFPSEKLQPYIQYFVVSENNAEIEYKVFPTTGLVMGFQYLGQLSKIEEGTSSNLSKAGITGISDKYKIFKNQSPTGTVLVYFTAAGFAHFTSNPIHELFNLSISLKEIFEQNKVIEVEERLAAAKTDVQRVEIVERFLCTQLRAIEADRLIVSAVKKIDASNGNIRIKTLQEQLLISQSAFEKRFRKIVGTSPKKFASIVRFNAVLKHLDGAKSLTDICYENHFFDQAHFIKDFKQFTGDTPEHFKRFL